MNTYFRHTTTGQEIALRGKESAAVADLKKNGYQNIPATAGLRSCARLGIINTYRWDGSKIVGL